MAGLSNPERVPNLAFGSIGSAQTPDEIVVVFVRADPEPDNQIAGPSRERSVRRSEPH